MNYTTNSKSHISKDYFYSILSKRIFEYEEALYGTRKQPGIKLSMVSAIEYHIQKLKTADYVNNLFGKDVWGYGINSICDGKIEQEQLDVFQIQKIGGLNKWHEPYRQLLLLIFKIENNFLFVNTFAIDTLQVGFACNMNMKYDLKNLENTIIKNRPNYIFVEFHFKNLEKPISFQIDTYHFGGNYLCGNELAQYYIESVEATAINFREIENKNDNIKINFIKDFILGIQHLQRQDINAECIRKLKKENKKDESLFRYWFDHWLTAKDYITSAEPQKGSGRIDLKVSHNSIGEKIIEFKGWWNQDKKQIIQQLHSYLTEFEDDGYIFMINHKSQAIDEEYRQIITNIETKYLNDTWKELKFENTGYSYFISNHHFNSRIRTIYHFIMSVN